ncbi:hypothetical protein GCM10009555_058940 [Acrocarpospora macrocephala]|uniref:Uncharacterized protein n=1 Tax=Acrocarpospora macrocephala TaxID=150177 RepID=A0A5M3WX55_9ACTN|nr:hypothetical protein [Acrocarpospora macrocephala]GES11881.1 hypothetical protein Amac_054780 [Acrocarpospora macrocephala]
MTSVNAGWALYTKVPGDWDEASVRASGGPESHEGLTALVRAAMPGKPRTAAGDQPQLPWATFFCFEDEHEWLSVSLLESSNEVDGTRARITPVRFYCMPYQEIAPLRAGYAGLYAAVAAVPLPSADGPPLTLVPEPMDLGRVAQLIDGLGLRWVASVASMLLEARVCVVEGAQARTLTERLDCLDAIAALLPYGYRARLNAAGWTDNAVPHRIRLSFSTRPGNDMVPVEPGSDGAEPQGEPARRYLADLLAAGEEAGTLDIVTHLADDRRPYDLADPAAALAAVQLLGQVTPVLRSYRSGGRPRGWASRLRPGRAASGDRVSLAPDLVRAAIHSGDQEERDLVDRHWDATTHQLIAEAIADSPELPLPAFIDLADRHGDLDRMLAIVVRRTASVEVLLSCDAPGPQALPQTREAVLAGPVDALLERLAFGQVPRSAAWLSWLTAGNTPGWLSPLRGLRTPTPTDVRAMLDHGPAGLVLLIERTPDLPTLLPAVWPLLIHPAVLPETARVRIAGIFTARSDRPWCDLALLVLGRTPVLPDRVDRSSAEQYLNTLTGLWHDKVFDEIRPRLAAQLIDELLARSGKWAKALPHVTDDVLLRELDSRDNTAWLDDPSIDPSYWSTKGASLGKSHRKWLRKALGRDPEPLEAASRCAEAITHGMPETEVLPLLAAWPRVNRMEELDELLWRLAFQLDAAAWWDHYIRFADLVWSGVLGSETATGYLDWLLAKAPGELADAGRKLHFYHQVLLRAAARG